MKTPDLKANGVFGQVHQRSTRNYEQLSMQGASDDKQCRLRKRKG
jgi:hypothetical protein